MSQWAPLPAPPQLPFQPQYIPPPPSKPSGVYKALGVVQMIFGVGGVLYSLLGVATNVWSSKIIAIYDTTTTAALVAIACASVVSGSLLFTAGLGVVRARRWSRWVGLLYAGFSLCTTLASAAIQVLIVQPRVMGSIGGVLGTTSSFRPMLLISTAFSVLISSILPVITAVMLLRRAARTELDQ